MSLRPRSWWLRRKLSKWNKNVNLADSVSSALSTVKYKVVLSHGCTSSLYHKVHDLEMIMSMFVLLHDYLRTINILKDLKFLSKFIQGALLLKRKENCLQDKNNNILGQETHTSVNRHGNSIKFRKNWLTPRAGRPIWTKNKTIFKFEVE